MTTSQHCLADESAIRVDSLNKAITTAEIKAFRLINPKTKNDTKLILSFIGLTFLFCVVFIWVSDILTCKSYWNFDKKEVMTQCRQYR